MRTMKHILLSVAALLISAAAHAQFSSVSTNLAGWAVGNLNAAMDFSLDKRNTINIPVSGNPFSFGETRWQHIAVQPGWRHWLVERYIGHFISPSLFYANYRLGYDRRTYEGNAYGAGFSWGYSILLNTRWNFLVEVGAGIIYTPYDEKLLRKYVGEFDDEFTWHHRRVLFLPTKINFSFSSLF